MRYDPIKNIWLDYEIIQERHIVGVKEARYRNGTLCLRLVYEDRNRFRRITRHPITFQETEKQSFIHLTNHKR